MTNEDKAFPPPPEPDDLAHVTVTEELKTILGTGGVVPPEQGTIFREVEIED